MSILPGILTPLFLSKIVIAGILLVFLYNLFQAIKHGRRLSRMLWCCTFSTLEHKKYAKRSFWILTLAVSAVEATVTFLGEAIYDTLFWVHFSLFALPCYILVGLIVFKYTGIRHRDLHGKLVYKRLLPLLIGTLLTGVPLLYRL